MTPVNRIHSKEVLARSLVPSGRGVRGRTVADTLESSVLLMAKVEAEEKAEEEKAVKDVDSDDQVHYDQRVARQLHKDWEFRVGKRRTRSAEKKERSAEMTADTGTT